MDEHDVLPADVVAVLTDRLEEGEALDVTDGPADLGITTSTSCSPTRRIRSLISLVTCGMTWTVSPR
jgi:hypothetical protein